MTSAKQNPRLSRVVGAAVLLSCGACTQVERIRDETGGVALVPTDVQRVFDTRCATGGCHDAVTAAEGLDLSAGASRGIIGGISSKSPLPLVDLGNVAGSYLAVKILVAPPAGQTREGDRMPTNGDFANDALALDLAVILGWIAGADLPGGEGGNDTLAGDDDGGGAIGCSLFEVAPGVMSPVQAGTVADSLPLEIGNTLERNCGCHYASTLVPGFAPYTGPMQFRTFAEFHQIYPGPVPAYAGLENFEVVFDRVADEISPMPPASCMPQGGGTITATDRILLVNWLSDGAPDAPTWAGMPGTGG